MLAPNLFESNLRLHASILGNRRFQRVPRIPPEILDLTDILDPRDRDYRIDALRSRWSLSGTDFFAAGGRGQG